MKRHSSFAIVLLGLLGVFVFSPSSGAQITAWGEAAGQLWTVQLPSGEMAAVGPTGLGPAGRMEELARSPDGRLLGLLDDGGIAELYELDTRSGVATLIGSFVLNAVEGLAALVDGRIFVTAGTQIYEVGPSDGTIRIVADLGVPLGPLADDGEDLLAFTTDPPWQILSVDPTTGASSLVNSSAELSPSPFAVMVTSGGDLWTLRRAGGIPEYSGFIPQRTRDFGAGDITTFDGFAFPFTDPEARLSSLAFRGVADPVAIPSLAFIGRILLILLLAMVGWYGLARR